MSTEQPPSTTTARDFTVRRTATPASEEGRARMMTAPPFGSVFTDHMARMTWTADTGWTDRRIEPYGPLQLDPAAAVLHYGQEIFEGLKAYRHDDGSVWAFRPHANAARFRASARRMAMPELPVEDFLGAIEALVGVDAAWVPSAEETSLYLRPLMFASEAFVGVRSARAMEFVLIISPTGPYFADGVKPVSIWVSQNYHRSGPGGTGTAKCGGNYAAAFLPQQEAHAHGCEQVCFLDAATGTYLEELGLMHIFVVYADGRVATPALTGTILEGVTRSSVLTLLRGEGRDVAERAITLTEVRDGLGDGSIAEAFACGTAAVVTPIGRLAGEGFDLAVADGRMGPVTAGVRRRLTDIQYGRSPDTHGWLHRLV